jgi:mRNA-degrading endonuclease RelE of RelBE toxin-antitoxin system
MNYEIIATQRFSRELKRLLKKYQSLKSEYAQLVGELESNPYLGEPIGNDCYKIRVRIASKQKGKSGGARMITFVCSKKENVYLLAVYDKSEVSSMGENVINSRIGELKL